MRLWNLRLCDWIDPAIVGPRRRNPREEGMQTSRAGLRSFLACSDGLKAHIPAKSRISRRQPFVGDGYSPAAALPRRVACSVRDGGLNVFSPAEVPADVVRVLLWLFFSGVVALIVDEVGERITQEAGEVKKAREREHNPK